MISCIETVLVYNELFSFLEEKHGKNAVEEYWRHVADTAFSEPRRIIGEGLDGVYRYLHDTWLDEGDLIEITRDERSVTVNVKDCSSVRKLRVARHVKRYHDYCGHCPVMYRRLFSSLGYDFEMEHIDPARGVCRVCVRRRA
jgi:hypothetical protein